MWPCIIEVSFGLQNLRRDGPLLDGWFNYPSQSRPSRPEGVAYVLVDTGSPNIAIDEELARTLGLPQLEPEKTQGVDGQFEADMFMAKLCIPMVSADSQPFLFAINIPVFSVRDLVKSHEDIMNPQGKPAQVVGVIGRVFLQFCKITYDGRSGHMRLVVHEEVMQPTKF